MKELHKKYYKKIIIIVILILSLKFIGCSSYLHRLNYEGVELVKKGKYDDAIVKFKKAIELYPDNKKSYINLAKVYLIKKEYKKSLKAIKKALEIDNKDLEANLLLVQIYFNLDKKDKAEKILKRLSSYYPKNYYIYLTLGDLAFIYKEWDKAINFYNKALKVNPRLDIAYIQLGRIYLYKEIEKILHKKEKVIKLPLEHNTKLMLTKIGRLISTGGLDLDKSIAYFRKALYINSKSITAHILLGLISLYTGSYEEAEIEFKEALSLSPNNPFIFLALGLNSQYKGEYDKALEYFNKAQELTNSVEPLIFKIFLYIDKKDYKKAIELSIKVCKKYIKEEDLFNILKYNNYYYNIKWLISMLNNPNKEIKEFCLRALKYITGKTFKYVKEWKEWLKSNLKIK